MNYSKPSKYRNKPVRRKIQNRPEEDLQRQCADWLRWVLPPPPAGPVWTFVNNGMKRTRAEAGIAKAMGQRAGWPDINMIWNGEFHAFEAKSPNRTAKPDKGNQEDCQVDIERAGGTVWNFNSFDNFTATIEFLASQYRCRLKSRKS